jgi:hydrogenase nickel incorporation protein HypA/HybF
MHELMITESVLELALRYGCQAGATRITDLYLVVGELSSVVDDSVQFYWDFVSEGTMAEGARLHFRRIAAELACLDCDRRYSPREDLICPGCGSTHVEIKLGREFYLESIEISRAPVEAEPADLTGVQP